MVATQTPNRLLSGPLGDPLLEEFSLSADADRQSDAGEVFGLGPEPGGGGGVAQVSLNELSRCVGLAKSNVLRYFESREAVLLELLDSAWQEWLAGLDEDLAVVDPNAPPAERGDQLAAALASSLASRPVLCDLISAQAAVLEHNLSAKVAAEYKRAAIANVVSLAQLVVERLPELGEHDAFRFAAAAVMVTGAVWTHAKPSAVMLAAYEADPDLASMRLDFLATLRQVLEVLIAGLLARSSR